MPRASLTAEMIDSFRGRACEIATELFAKHGVGSVSMRQIAAELGVSPMTPYRYFQNKEELFAAVRTTAFRRFADRQEHAFEESWPGDRLHSLAAAYIAFANDEPAAYKVMFELEQVSPEGFPDLEHEQRRAFAVLLRTVSEACENGRMDGDPTTAAHLLWAQIHGLVSLHLAGKLIMGRSFEELCSSPTIVGMNGRTG